MHWVVDVSDTFFFVRLSPEHFVSSCVMKELCMRLLAAGAASSAPRRVLTRLSRGRRRFTTRKGPKKDFFVQAVDEKIIPLFRLSSFQANGILRFFFALRAPPSTAATDAGMGTESPRGAQPALAKEGPRRAQP
mmetsp:Transcript_41631/g.76953  ORF Transcript_41631/g.76953 Transcript_41631/m.76953 type:complete len:134 (-) Transcript_41631:186-587(-)